MHPAARRLPAATISGNSAYLGGGINNYDGTLIITGSTLSGNSARDVGGGINFGFGTATLTNDTLSENSATEGGGIYNNYGTLTLTNDTLSENSAVDGGGINNLDGTVQPGNTIIAGNRASSVGPDFDGAVASLGFNLIGITAGSSGLDQYRPDGYQLEAAQPIAGAARELRWPDADDGPFTGSPAIDAGSSAIAGAPSTDRAARQPAPGLGRRYRCLRVARIHYRASPKAAGNRPISPSPLACPLARRSSPTFRSNRSPGDRSPSSRRRTARRPAPSAQPCVDRGGRDGEHDGHGQRFRRQLRSNGNGHGCDQLGLLLAHQRRLAGGQRARRLSVNPAGFITLRLAITYAESFTAGSPTITFDPSVFDTAQTIDLNSALPNLSDTVVPITIIGPVETLPTTNLVTISEAGGFSNYSAFAVNAGVTATISGLTIAHFDDANGGVILNDGTLTLTNDILTDDFAGGNGGGILNQGTMTLTNDVLTQDIANGNGGGIQNNGTATLIDDTISENRASDGGGIFYSAGGTLMVTDSSIIGNAASDGGGIDNEDTATVTDSTIANNLAEMFGGGNYNDSGMFSVTGSNISGNSAGAGGGGICDNPSPQAIADGTATIIDSTITGNSAYDGGGILNNDEGTVTIIGSTLTDNSATNGGGVDNLGVTTVTNATIADNSATYGGGIFSSDGTLTAVNCTIAYNDVGGGGPGRAAG